jgi:hypothetical protein
MKQVIVYSLYGDNPRYTVGAIKNAQLAQVFFPGFKVRYYYGLSVPEWVVSTLSIFDNVELVPMDQPENNLAKLWRFQAFADPMISVVLSRDTDARLSLREAIAHIEWQNSGLPFHIIRDHPTGHKYTISAGMFAAKADVLRDIEKLIRGFPLKDTYSTDQDFLGHVVWPRIRDNAFQHDPYYKFDMLGSSIKKEIPRPPINPMCHIGAALDENDRFIYQVDRVESVKHSGNDKYLYDWGL